MQVAGRSALLFTPISSPIIPKWDIPGTHRKLSPPALSVLPSQDQNMKLKSQPDPAPPTQVNAEDEDEPVERITLPPDQDQTALAHKEPDSRPRGIRVPPPPPRKANATISPTPEPYTGPKGIRVPPPPPLRDSEVLKEPEAETRIAPSKSKSEPESESLPATIYERLSTIGIFSIKTKASDPAPLPPSPEQQIERKERVLAPRTHRVAPRLPPTDDR